MCTNLMEVEMEMGHVTINRPGSRYVAWVVLEKFLTEFNFLCLCDRRHNHCQYNDRFHVSKSSREKPGNEGTASSSPRAAKDEVSRHVLPANRYSSSSSLPPSCDTSDLTRLIHLHEPAVVECLRIRYALCSGSGSSGAAMTASSPGCYTASDPVLIAVNPCRNLPGLYDEDAVRRVQHSWPSPLRRLSRRP